MKFFKLPTQIHKFDDFKGFAEEFKIGEGDLVLTHQFLYDPFMKELNLGADFLMQEKYGVGEPSDEMIDQILADVTAKQYKRIIAVGGGSVIDIAKLLIFKDGKNALDMFEKKIDFIKDKELIIVPTTCGTGSEVTNISIAEIKSKHTKMGLAIDELYADYAVLIPELVKGLPYKFFVYSSIDALIHAIESYVSPNANDFTQMISVKATEMILKGYLDIIEKGEDYRLEILEDFVIASNYAGIAFGNTGVGAVHALSYPLGGTYHVPHGEANYQFFTEVFKTYNRINPDGKIKELNTFLADLLKVEEKDVYDAIENVLDKLLSKKPLKEYGMKEEEIESFTDSVLEKQQRLLANNYVPLSREDILNIYKNLYYSKDSIEEVAATRK
ncbi:4-hydroxybutyrate dehydrogenase [Crassaminicella thermophila]|uniref:4-hydroxybutyrate dehydrogenase n=1 Tax=Crassaminicella thermophila TaxID=2599308 RepID=A0A5C0SHS9_CRATE|nr:4-hydroxybutyrate dehydrogenase [Crassaminicella thermophila]QEK12509.1 4-hydroxybutyrate dehydrogenase [Crassaminicella thermophila]